MDTDFVFAVDLDGVCANYVKKFREVVEPYRPHIDTAKAHDWWFTEWGLTKADVTMFHEILVVKEGFRSLEPFPGVSKALWRLSDAGVYIRILTHRLTVSGHHSGIASDTVHWLEDNNIPYRDLCFMGKKADLDADLYVDDAPHNITDLQAAGRNVVIFDQVYNRHLSGVRVQDWDYLADLVLKRMESPGKVWPL